MTNTMLAGTTIISALPSEGRPLTDHQTAVVQLALERLIWMAEAAPKQDLRAQPQPGFLVEIDDERRNHVLLIDGARGSGKTVALVALLETLRRSVRGGEALHGLMEAAKSIPSKNIFPLRILDLRPFPAGRSLILELPGAFLPVIESLEHTAGYANPSGDAPPPLWQNGEHPARTAWRRFTHVAATGFARDVRDGHVDPGTFVEELAQAGVERACVQSTFRTLVDELCRGLQVPEGLGRGLPFFVLSIDDADMQPDRCLDLLDMVRLFRHPRLAFVLTGDSELFQSVLRNQMAQWLSAGTSDVFISKWGDELATRADGLARQFLEKHLPPPDRLRLPSLPPNERVRVLLSEVHPGDALDSLRTLLKTVLARSLPDNLRSLGSLRARLESIPATTDFRSQLFAKGIWDYVLENDDISDSARYRLHETMRPGVNGFTPQPGIVQLEATPQQATVAREPAHVRMQWDLSFTATMHEVGGQPTQVERAKFVREAEERPWARPQARREVDESENASSGEKVSLPSQTANAYALLLSQTVNIPKDSAKVLLHDLRQSAVAAVAIYERPDLTFRANWPLPRWRSLRDYIGFFERWAEAAAVAYTEPAEVSARWFVKFVEEVSRGGDKGLFFGDPPSWKELVACLDSTKRVVNERDQFALKRWRKDQLAMLTTPEAGLGVESANELFACLNPDENLPAEPKEARVDWLVSSSRLTGPGAHDAVLSFCRSLDRDAKFEWTRSFDKQTLRDQLLNLMRGVRTAGPDLQALAQLSQERRDDLDRMSPDSLKTLHGAFQGAPSLKFGGKNAQRVMNEVWSTLREDETYPRVGIWFRSHKNTAIRGGDLVRFSSPHDRPYFSFEPAISEPDLFVFRLKWDVETIAGTQTCCALTDMVADSTQDIVAWDGIEAGAPKRYKWPVPAYREMVRWEWWIHDWNTVEFPSQSKVEPWFIDGLAAVMIQRLVSIARQNMNSQPREEALRVSADGADELGSLTFRVLSDAIRSSPIPLLQRWARLAYIFFSDPELSSVSERFAEALKTAGEPLATREEVKADLALLQA